MKWFKHDANAHIDAKLKKVKHKYGIVGYGIYWYCIELIAMGVDRNNITFELEEDSETIAMEWSLDQLKVQEIMEYMVHLNLFELQSGRITCLKLAKRLDDTNSKNPEIRRVLEQLGASEPEQNEPKDSDLLGDTPKDSAQIRLEEIRLEEIRKRKEFEKVLNGLFLEFWKVYPNKNKKKGANASWLKAIKTEDQAQEVIAHVTERSNQDQQWLKDSGKYIPLPTTFLNQELWTDEYQKGPSTQPPQPIKRKPLPRPED